MKTAALILGIVLFANGNSFAGNGENLFRIISKKIAYPASLAEKKIETTVKVILFVDAEGTVIVRKIYCDSEEMKLAIETQLKNIDFGKMDELTGKTFQYNLKMDLEK